MVLANVHLYTHQHSVVSITLAFFTFPSTHFSIGRPRNPGSMYFFQVLPRCDSEPMARLCLPDGNQGASRLLPRLPGFMVFTTILFRMNQYSMGNVINTMSPIFTIQIISWFPQYAESTWELSSIVKNPRLNGNLNAWSHYTTVAATMWVVGFSRESLVSLNFTQAGN